MNEYYTYAYLRENGTPYYIGKGKGYRIHSTNRRIALPIKERRIFLKKNLTEDEAIKHEIYMISIFGRKDLGTGILLNMTDGGEGTCNFRHNEDAKKAISIANTKYTPEEKIENKRKSNNRRRTKWIDKNPEKKRQYNLTYNEKNREKRREYARLYRERMKNK
jgi:hypothetical protein